MFSYMTAVIAVLMIVDADQYTKLLALKYLSDGTNKPFIKGIMNFSFVENNGGAWGILAGNRWILLAVTAVVMAVIIFVLIKFGRKSKLLFWALTLVLSGGIGNMIDRIFRNGYVIDFLHTEFIDFPTFNVADCAVVIGAGLLILYFVLDTVIEMKKKKQTDKVADENGED